MSKIDLLPVREATSVAAGSSATVPLPRRSPPTAVKLLVPVWGYQYVRQFLEVGLPTLLAPGNVPAVAKALRCEFIFLTSADDQDFIRENSAFTRLSEICHTEIRLIDHLITESNVSTTITLAYTEVVRSTGDAMLDTCFFFLVSDYVMADGSLGNALARVLNGASAVLVGNFQVVREDALPWLEQKLRGSGTALTWSPRELMEWGLNYLHPATIANMVNTPLSHNSHTNRLFWRVDGNTLLGRFYLMHMLCVRPEVDDFVIGASCDYSFVPEMCPSGNLEAITDSDEYLVIELQPRHHEVKFLRPGPLKPSAVAKSLSEWTTRSHRDNARYSVVFHADEVPANIDVAIAEADAFIEKVARAMRAKPHPHRGHMYWRGAMAAFNEAIGRKVDLYEWHLALGMAYSSSWLTDWLLWRARYSLLGSAPHVYPWHPFWPDFRIVLAELEPFFTQPSTRLLMISNAPTVFTVALADNGERVHRLRSTPFLQSPADRYAPLASRFDLCLLELSEADMAQGDELVDRIIPLMKDSGRILVTVWNRRSIGAASEFRQAVAYHAPRFVRRGALPTSIQYLPASRLRWMAHRGLARLRMFLTKWPPIGLLCAVIGGTVLLVLCGIANLACLRAKTVIRRGIASSVIMALRVDAVRCKDGYSRFQIQRRQHWRRELGLRLPARAVPEGAEKSSLHAPAASQELIATVAETAEEVEHSGSVTLKNTIGLASLGLLTNRIWNDDPAQLGILLARYRFIAKMMRGRVKVAEVGCGDAFGTRVVQQEVGRVAVYDSDRIVLGDVRARQDECWPLEVHLHDIVKAPLPNRYDGLYSLGVLEHLSRFDEHCYLENLRDSLTVPSLFPASAEQPVGQTQADAKQQLVLMDVALAGAKQAMGGGGILIVGTRPTQLAAEAAPRFADSGELNPKSGRAFRALMEQYFARVFMFSMRDEIVQSGVDPTAHYLFALCTDPK